MQNKAKKSFVFFDAGSTNVQKRRLILKVPRFVGPAVTRNKIKRWVRFFFEKKPKGCSEVKVVFRKKEGEFYKKLTYKKLSSELEKLFKEKF